MRKPLSFGSTMLASALGVVIVSVVSGLIMFISMIVMVATLSTMGNSETTVVKPASILTVELDHISGDRTADKLTQSFGGSNTIGLLDATRAIRNAANDDNIEALLVKDNGATVSTASLEELRDAIADFQAGGKKVISYATSYSQTGYYLASISDFVCLHPSGMIEFRGMGGQVMYYKDLLDKLGVEMQLIRPESCSYKSAGEVYTLSKMSQANREQIRAYIQSTWNTITADISKSRNISVEDLNKMADNLSAFMADDACVSGLVDTLCFEEDVRNMLRETYGGKHLLPIDGYAKNVRMELESSTKKIKDAIAVIYAEGNVVDGTSKGMGTAVYGDDIVKAFRQAMDDDDVKAIVLRVNSPGGQATASESMTHAIMQAREKKPVVVSMGDLAASAGYEMSCMADAIVAQPMTITGSIGVFGTVPNMGKLMRQKLGVNPDTVSTNRNASGFSLFDPLSPAAMDMMTRNVEDFYKVFVGRVAEGRHMTFDEVHSIARGRVWTGVDALAIGLVDTLGGFDIALSIAAEKAGIEKYRIKEYPAEKDVWTQLTEMMGESSSDDLDLGLGANPTLWDKMRLALSWKMARKNNDVVSRLEQDLIYVSESEGLQARLPFVFID